MTRDKAGPIDLREPIHCHPYRVVYADTDAAGVMYYGTYMRLLERGRTEYIRSIVGMPYSWLTRRGIALPVSEAYVRYKAPAAYDDVLEIRTSLAGFSRVSIRFHYEIRREKDERLLVKGFTVHASVNNSGRLTSLPEDYQIALNNVMEIVDSGTIPVNMEIHP